MAITVKDVVIWSIPLGIAAAAAVFGVTALRDHAWDEPPTSSVAPPPTCPERVYRCREREVQVSTGEPALDGKSCAFKRVGGCERACASQLAALAGVDDQTAKTQLCDAPKHPARLVSAEQNFLTQPVSEAGVCETDGFIPTDDGFLQCVAKSGIDPNATGVVIARTTCRLGAVPTTDRSPRLIKREEAIAVWCKRDPDPNADVDAPDAGASFDARVDAPGDAADAATDARDAASSG